MPKKGYKQTEEHKRKLKGKRKRSGENNPNWKGDSVGYMGVHHWIRKVKGKANHCEWCGDKSSKKYEWANIDHKYQRKEDDFISLCVTCHKKHDYKKFFKYKKKINVKCLNCDIEFITEEYKLNNGLSKFCSKKCFGEFKKGKGLYGTVNLVPKISISYKI